jgi:hypothetical protein
MRMNEERPNPVRLEQNNREEPDNQLDRKRGQDLNPKTNETEFSQQWKNRK